MAAKISSAASTSRTSPNAPTTATKRPATALPADSRRRRSLDHARATRRRGTVSSSRPDTRATRFALVDTTAARARPRRSPRLIATIRPISYGHEKPKAGKARKRFLSRDEMGRFSRAAPTATGWPSASGSVRWTTPLGDPRPRLGRRRFRRRPAAASISDGARRRASTSQDRRGRREVILMA